MIHPLSPSSSNQCDPIMPPDVSLARPRSLYRASSTQTQNRSGTTLAGSCALVWQCTGLLVGDITHPNQWLGPLSSGGPMDRYLLSP